MLTEKYRPRKMEDYVGHKMAAGEFLKWAKEWKPGTAVILHGPPGVGKTSLVYAFARQNDLDLIETNASDLRSSKELREKISSSVSQKSLSRKGKIFLFDEVDGLSGYEDKGGVSEMMKIVDETQYPVVLIANDPYNKKLIGLRKKTRMIPFRRLTVWDLTNRLQKIADAEKVPVSREHIREIAKKADGDMRSAINDLETICSAVKPSPEEMQQTGLREREVSIFDAMKTIFKSESARMAKMSIGSVDKAPDEVFWWVENNVAREYEDPDEVAAAYEMLSRADIFRRRIYFRQNWKLLAYMVDFMTGGVAVSKKKPYRKFTRYEYPQNIMIMGRTKAARAAQREVLSRLGKELHCSSRKIRWEFLPFLKTFDDEVKEAFK